MPKTTPTTPKMDVGSAGNGVNSNENGINGSEALLNKEQKQLEKLLQIIEKKPSATQAYYAEEMGVSKRTVSRMFVSTEKRQTGTEWNNEKS